MPEEIIPFPVLGLSETFAFGIQEPGTSRDLLNMRAVNPRNGRIMGAQRSGLTNHASDLVNQTNKVIDLNVIGYDQRAVTWSYLQSDIQSPENLDSNYWTFANGLTVMTNDRASPDGRITAERLTDASAVSLGAIYRDFSSNDPAWLSNGVEASFSVHTRLRTADTNDVQAQITLWHVGTNILRPSVRLLGATNPPRLEFRSNESAAWRPVVTNDSVLFESEEDGYFRFGIGNTFDTSASATLRAEFLPLRPAATIGSAWAWGAQFEPGLVPGPYKWRENKVLDSKAGAVNVQADQYGNMYVLDEKANVVKFSPDLKQVWSIPLPLQDKRHIVRALHVDRIGCVYAAVSEGGDQEKAKIWKYVQLPENEFELWWTIEPEQYVEEIKSFQDVLYTAHNDDGRKHSRVVVYDQILSRTPKVSWETGDVRVPYPIRGMDIDETGDILISADEPVGSASAELYRLTAGTKGAALAFHPTSIDANAVEILHPNGMEALGNGAFEDGLRIWAHYRAEDVITNDVEGEFEEGAKVLRWRDVSGNERHLTVPTDSSSPTLTFNGPGGKAALRFNGQSNALQSAINGGSARANRDQQRTILPGYDASRWIMSMVCRPVAESNVGCVISQQNTDTNAFEWGVFANRDEGSNGVSNMVFGQMSVYDDTTNSLDNATGTDAHPLSGTFTNELNNAVIVTYLHNNNFTSPGSTYASFRLNGTNVENNFFSAAFTTSNARTYVGRTAAGTNYYSGDLSEILLVAGAQVGQWTGGQDAAAEDAYPLNDTTPNTNGTTAQGHGLEVMEGYLAYSYGMFTLLPGGSAVTNQHAYGTDSNGFPMGPPSIVASDVSNFAISPNAAIGQSFLKYPLVTKISSENGSFKWLANENTTNMTGVSAGGVGYAAIFDHSNGILCVGPDASDTNGVRGVRKFIDNGDSIDLTTTNGAWVGMGSTETWNYKTPRIVVDHSNNLYLPINLVETATNDIYRVYRATGRTSGGTYRIVHGYAPDGQAARAIAIDPFIPDYGDDLANEVAPNVFVASDNSSDVTVPALHKIPIVKANQNQTPPRAFKLIAVADTSLEDVTTSGAYTTPTGAAGAVDRRARYVQSAALFQKLYYVDGKGVPRVYDPKEGEVTKLKADVGSIPDGARLVEAWRGRLVLGRTHNEPQNWFMSKRDDPKNWEFIPFQPIETQAVAGNDTEAGLFPDILNTLVPYSEDILIFGGDKSIYQMSGDPAAGGRFDLITDKTGMAFGRPWTKDPNGILYFFGSRGGLYRMTPGSIPERISVNRVERRLQDIDFSTYYVRLEYNWRDEGIHILLLPYGAGGTQVEHYFYSIKVGGFFPDKFGTTTSTGVQPTSAVVMDGDAAGDRVLFFGCEDGRIRKWNKDSVSDGGTLAIDSFVTINLPRTPGYETIYKGLTAILSHSQQGTTFGMHVGQNPDHIGGAVKTGKLSPGRNMTRWDRTRGSHGWLKLRNARLAQSWGVEEILIEADAAGKARSRSGLG